MNRSIGTSTPSSPPRKPSIWFAGAFRPSRVTAGADRLPSERHEDRSVHPHQGRARREPAASLESTLIHIGLIKIDGTRSIRRAPRKPKRRHSRRRIRVRSRDADTPRCRSMPSPPSASPRRSRGAGAGIGCFVRSGIAPHGALSLFLIAKENHHGSHIGIRSSVAPIVVLARLTLRTIRGKNGPSRSAASPRTSVRSRSKTRSWSSTPKASTTGNSSSGTSSRSPIRSAAACGSRSVPAWTA